VGHFSISKDRESWVSFQFPLTFEYEVCGYRSFWVSRTDGQNLSRSELTQIQDEVTEDLRFDYSDDELEFWFDDTAVEGILQVNLQDIDSCGYEDEATE
jgi:hypothetical protein